MTTVWVITYYEPHDCPEIVCICSNQPSEEKQKELFIEWLDRVNPYYQFEDKDLEINKYILESHAYELKD